MTRAAVRAVPALQWSGEARAQVSHAWFGFTEGQDLKVSAGYRATFTPQSITSKVSHPVVITSSSSHPVVITWGWAQVG